MSVSVQEKLTQGASPIVEAALVKELGTTLEQFIPAAIADDLFSREQPEDVPVELLLTLKYILQNRGRNRAELSRLLLADFGYTADPEARSVSALVPAREFLGDEDLTLLSRFVNEDRSFREAAADTGVSVSECQLRFRRARRRLLSRTNPEKYLR